MLFTDLRRVVLTNYFISILYTGQTCVFKRRKVKEKSLNQNFLYRCTSTHCVLNIYKVSRNFGQLFARSCDDKLDSTILYTC